MRLLNKICGTLIGVCVFFWACNDTSEPPEDLSEQNLKAFLGDIYGEVININKSVSIEVVNLRTAFNDYSSSLDTESKEALQDQWKKTTLEVCKSRIFDISSIEKKLYFSELYNTPISDSFLEDLEEYKGEETLDVTTFPASFKGLAVLEFLFYEVDSLENYTGLVNGIINDLELINSNITLEWEGIEDDFVSGNTITINDGLGELINGWVAIIEVSRKTRFQEPFGLVNSGDFEFEAQRAEYSKELLFGAFGYLDETLTTYLIPFLKLDGKEDLANDIETASGGLIASFKTIEDLNVSFKNIDTESNSESLNDVVDGFTGLLLYIKVELANEYDSLVTFTSADGD